MSNSIVEKLKMHKSNKILILNAPDYYIQTLQLPVGAELLTSITEQPDFILMFTLNIKDLRSQFEKLKANVTGKEIFWVSYPKKISGMKTDLNRDVCWKEFKTFDYEAVTQISLDEQWSALRVRPVEQVKKSSVGKESIMQNSEFSQYIDFENKRVTLPDELANALASSENAKKFFDTLTFSHKKEYIIWVMGAKKAETKLKRLTKAIEMLETGVKK